MTDASSFEVIDGNSDYGAHERIEAELFFTGWLQRKYVLFGIIDIIFMFFLLCWNDLRQDLITRYQGPTGKPGSSLFVWLERIHIYNSAIS